MAQPLYSPDTMNMNRLDRLVDISPAATISRSLFTLPDFRQIAFSMDAGQEMSEHTSPFLAIVQVISGRLNVSVTGQTRVLERDAWLTMPPHAPHSLFAVEPTRFLLTLVRVSTAPSAGRARTSEGAAPA